MTRIRPSSLNTPCYGAIALSASGPQTRTEYSGFGQAWAATVECRPDALTEVMKLTPDERQRLIDAGTWYASEHPLPPDARHNVRVALDREGHVVDYESPDAITCGSMDHTGEEDGGDLVWVRDDKTGQRPVPNPSENLQTAAYLVARMDETCASRGRVEIVNPILRTYEEYVFTRDEITVLWERIVAKIDGYDPDHPEYSIGAHCDECYQRRHCPAHLMPAMQGAEALLPFTRPGGLTAETLPAAWRVVKAMEAITDEARGAMKAFVAEHGPQDLGGGKVLRFVDVAGGERRAHRVGPTRQLRVVGK